VNSDWNKDLKIKFTTQDPMQPGSESPWAIYFADDLRFVVKTVVGEENFIRACIPTRPTTYCCGGGGGSLQAGYKEERLAYGKIKADQIQGHRVRRT
jgi:hypothetical protein